MSKRSCEAAESIEDASFANGAGERAERVNVAL